LPRLVLLNRLREQLGTRSGLFRCVRFLIHDAHFRTI
jgi:hypothetical protein